MPCKIARQVRSGKLMIRHAKESSDTTITTTTFQQPALHLSAIAACLVQALCFDAVVQDNVELPETYRQRSDTAMIRHDFERSLSKPLRF